jgi:hypothetical protein
VTNQEQTMTYEAFKTEATTEGWTDEERCEAWDFWTACMADNS